MHCSAKSLAVLDSFKSAMTNLKNQQRYNDLGPTKMYVFATTIVHLYYSRVCSNQVESS